MKLLVPLLCLFALPAFANDMTHWDLSFKVTDAAGKTTLIESSAAVDNHSSQRFVEHEAGSAQTVEMIVSADQSNDGTVVLRFDWKEHGADGHEVVWSPRLAMVRGSSGSAKVKWDGDGRTINVALK